MVITASLNTKQFAAFLAAMHTAYPEFRQETGGLPVNRAQIAKSADRIQIKALGQYTLPPDVEETAVRLLAQIQADATLMQDGEFRWSDVARHRPLSVVRAKRRRQRMAA